MKDKSPAVLLTGLLGEVPKLIIFAPVYLNPLPCSTEKDPVLKTAIM
jgi:hypothetical protein